MSPPPTPQKRFSFQNMTNIFSRLKFYLGDFLGDFVKFHTQTNLLKLYDTAQLQNNVVLVINFVANYIIKTQYYKPMTTREDMILNGNLLINAMRGKHSLKNYNTLDVTVRRSKFTFYYWACRLYLLVKSHGDDRIWRDWYTLSFRCVAVEQNVL